MSVAHSEGLGHQRPNSIHVNGQGRVSVRPDKADINLAVEVHTKTAKAAREQATTILTHRDTHGKICQLLDTRRKISHLGYITLKVTYV